MARLNKVKNLTVLVKCYAKSPRLRKLVNLVIIGGHADPNRLSDREEAAEIEKTIYLMKEYSLEGQFRWITAQMNHVRNGELYRCIADTRGPFVQLSASVVKAITCGLPTFATCHECPVEIIEDGVSGFHIDPLQPNEDSTSSLVELLQLHSYAGKKYSDRLLRLAGVYGFWKHVSRLDRREVCRYLEMFYILEFRDLVKSIPPAVDEVQ
ncbi:hypothetical protein CRG98_050317 [Punica granatum]|uniref:sucrose synthase n=1 Tax=Punica granatum TaxID=22663 RepID=A0A2I0GJE2_PUNGR|nr:hypothetical protein CRG98_050317 [Punica granatum]